MLFSTLPLLALVLLPSPSAAQHNEVKLPPPISTFYSHSFPEAEYPQDFKPFKQLWDVGLAACKKWGGASLYSVCGKPHGKDILMGMCTWPGGESLYFSFPCAQCENNYWPDPAFQHAKCFY